MDVQRTQSRHTQLLKELQEERAAALARIGRRLETLVDELKIAREQLLQASREERADRLQSYRRIRAQALKYRWYLEVQREAVGLRNHETIDEFYAIPEAM